MGERCKQPGCDRPKGRALGLCNAHWSRQHKGKDMSAPIRNWKATDSDRFWAKVNKTDSCWLWTGAKTAKYGVFRIGGRNSVAHRVSYRWAYGDIPEDVQLDHMCHNRSCVNPGHLRFSDWETNGQNRASANKNSKSGVRGVYWVEDRGGWFASITLNREVTRRGPFDDINDAEKAAIEMRIEHMPYSLMDQRKVS